MPRKPASQTDTYRLRLQIAQLWLAASAFVPLRRAEEMVRKWLLGGHVGGLSEAQKMAMVADATMFSTDLILSQPSLSGGTAFDRMARGRADATDLERHALEALCASRYRLLAIDDASSQRRAARVKDLISGETLHVAPGNLPDLHKDVVLFARVVGLAPEMYCIPGAVCPLETVGLDIARRHISCGAPGVAANARWAEAVFGHVVRHGTVGVPGLNRPDQGMADQDMADDLFGSDTIADLTSEWAALGDGPPNDVLLQRTRQSADVHSILVTLDGLLGSQRRRDGALERGCTRAALVMMEVIVRRERCGSGGLTLDGVAREIEDQIAHHGAPHSVRGAFAALRRKLGPNGAAPPDDPELARLMQRIQGLRGKTIAQGCKEHEAIAAAEKIAELLDKHGLSLDEIEYAKQPCEGVSVATGRKRQKPIDGCMNAIAAFFDCRVWQESRHDQSLHFVFFGLCADVAAARTLHELVARAFETETENFQAGAIYAAMEGERRGATMSFQVGLARGIRTKLDTLRAGRATRHRSASGRDLVQVKTALVDDELAKLGLSLSARQAGRRRHLLSDAFASGQAAGERFEWAAGIEEAA